MKTVFGSMNLGQQVFGNDAADMLSYFRNAGGTEIDTAYVYNDGECERLLGECFDQIGTEGFSVVTKVNPRVTGRLDYDAVKNQLTESLSRMHLDSVDLLYLHFPDPVVPIDEPIRACAELHAQGKFKDFGLSNFSLEQIRQVADACERLGCPLPSVYEGVYNALSRDVESELIGALREMDMCFRAYNPLAGGMLAGKYHSIADVPKDGRFSLRPGYRGRYWKESYFQAIAELDQVCKECDIPMAQASLRWLSHHSQLSESCGDGVIIGASRISQLEQNMASMAAGPLPQQVVDAFEHAWDITCNDAPKYHRFVAQPKK